MRHPQSDEWANRVGRAHEIGEPGVHGTAGGFEIPAASACANRLAAVHRVPERHVVGAPEGFAADHDWEQGGGAFLIGAGQSVPFRNCMSKRVFRERLPQNSRADDVSKRGMHVRDLMGACRASRTVRYQQKHLHLGRLLYSLLPSHLSWEKSSESQRLHHQEISRWQQHRCISLITTQRHSPSFRPPPTCRCLSRCRTYLHAVADVCAWRAGSGATAARPVQACGLELSYNGEGSLNIGTPPSVETMAPRSLSTSVRRATSVSNCAPPLGKEPGR